MNSLTRDDNPWYHLNCEIFAIIFLILNYRSLILKNVMTTKADLLTTKITIEIQCYSNNWTLKGINVQEKSKIILTVPTHNLDTQKNTST
jgi:hypothetical protein